MKTVVLAAFLAAPALAQAAELTIRQPWMRVLLPSLPAAGYMVLQNTGPGPAVLTGASSPACGSLMLHQSEEASGMAMMMDVPSITIPPGGSVTFAPGGYHLMCMTPRMKPGDKIPLTLTFNNGAKITAVAPVYGATTSP